MLRATGLMHVPEEAPLVELLKTLADEMDAGGGARTRADYLSALKDARRVLAVNARPKGTPESSVSGEQPEAEVAEEAPVPNDLAKFKAKRGIA